VFFERDVHAYWHPLISSFRSIVRSGSWPLWNPDVTFGAPLLADPNLQLAYPPTWATLCLSPLVYYTAFAALHCLWGAIGAYLLARAWSLSPLPAFTAAAAWCSSGPFLSAVSLFHHYAGAAWIPWVLWGLEGALASPRPRAVVLLALLAAGQMLAGSADMCLFAGLSAAGRGICFVLAGPQRARAVRVLLGVGGLGAALGFLLAAVQWIPTTAVMASSARTGHGLRTTTYWSLHPASLADLVVPNLVSGFPWGPTPRSALFESREPFLRCVYVGVVVAGLAALSLLGPGAARPRLIAAVLALFLLAALGRFTPARYLFVLPPLSFLRYAAKYVIPAALGFALLAGFGLQAWLAEWSSCVRRRAVFLLASLGAFVAACVGAAVWIARDPGPLLALGAEGLSAAGAGVAAARLVRAAEVGLATALLLWWRLRRPVPPIWLTGALLALLLADLGPVTSRVNPLAPAALLHDAPAAAAALPPGDRVYSAPHGLDWLESQLVRLPAGWDPAWAPAIGFRQRLSPPSAALWHLRGSYDGDFTGMAPPALGYLSMLAATHRDEPSGVKLLRMGGVRWAVSLQEMPALLLVGSYASVYASPVRVYQVPDPLPVAYWVGRARVASEPESYGILSGPDFDPTAEVVLAPPASPPASAGTRGHARVVRAQADRLVLETEADGPGFLVVVEAFQPGWRAEVDGHPAPVQRANSLFRAVEVAGGRHRVELRYRPASVVWGLALSGVGLLLSALAWRSDPGPAGQPVASRESPR
jgi:hypothetical protein